MQTTRKSAKARARARRKLIFRIKQVVFFSILAILAFLILFGLFKLISLPFRHSADAHPGAETSEVSEQSADEARFRIRKMHPEDFPQDVTISLVAFGDNLIHNSIYEYAWQEDGSYDFSEIYTALRDEIAEADLACIQQETIFVSDPSLYSNYPLFGTPAEMADTLVGLGFDVVCHASNHTYDKTMTGINDTLEKWKSYPEVAVLGIHASQEEADAITVVEREGIRLALLDYTYGLNNSYPQEDYTIDFIDSNHRDRIARQVAQAREQSDMVVVFMHMGDEDDLAPNAEQQEWAQFFADAGVGLVIGTSSHTIQPTEVLTGKDGNQMPIFYCLGNFLSSQIDTFNLVGSMARAEITKDAEGTYVSYVSNSPVVTWIQAGSGKPGLGYIFHVLHLEDYTDEMGREHIRDACMPEDFQSVWDSVFGDRAAIDLSRED